MAEDRIILLLMGTAFAVAGFFLVPELTNTLTQSSVGGIEQAFFPFFPMILGLSMVAFAVMRGRND